MSTPTEIYWDFSLINSGSFANRLVRFWPTVWPTAQGQNTVLGDPVEYVTSIPNGTLTCSLYPGIYGVKCFGFKQSEFYINVPTGSTPINGNTIILTNFTASVPVQQVAIGANLPVTSSWSVTASYALNGGGSSNGTASYVTDGAGDFIALSTNSITIETISAGTLSMNGSQTILQDNNGNTLQFIGTKALLQDGRGDTITLNTGSCVVSVPITSSIFRGNSLQLFDAGLNEYVTVYVLNGQIFIQT